MIQHRLIALSANLSIGFCGVYLAMYQLSLLQIAQNFHLSNVMMGTLVAIQYLGVCLPPMTLGTLSEKLGKRRIIIISMPLMVLGTFLISITNSLVFFVIGIFLCGAGFSVTEATMSAVLAAEFRDKSAFHLGISQAFFSLGAVLSPFACEALFKTGLMYRDLFGLACAIFLALYVLFLFTRQKNDISGVEKAGIGEAFRFFTKKTFILIAVAVFMSVGVEGCVAFFTDSYFELTLGAPEFSAVSISLLSAGMIPSRMLLGAIKLKHKTTVTIGCVGIILSLLIIVLTPVSAVKLIGYGTLGLFAGPIWPIMIDIATKKYPQNVGIISNVMMSIAGFGGATMPLVAGALVVGTNFIPIFLTSGICAIVMGITFNMAGREAKNKNT
ncbi:MAG: MFS transporter [Christensenellales bacterium]